MKQKLFTLLLAVAASVGTMFAQVAIDGLNYNLNSELQTAEVAGYRNASGDIIIPASVTYASVTYSVTSIGEYAFSNCGGLTSVTIPNSVTSIGDDAFYDCTGLTSVTIPNSVTSIGDDAFYDCTGLTSVHISDIAAWCAISFGNYSANPLSYAHNLYLNGELVTDLVIPNSVTSIGGSAFYGCTGLTSVTIPNSVTSIGERAFYKCSSLTSVTIPNSVTSIGDYAFFGCRGLTSVTIPNSVTSIGGSAFYGCTGLTSVTIPNSVTSIGEGAFSACSSLTSPVYNTHVFAYMPTSYSGAYTIPDGIESIAGSAFDNCTGLTSVTIPNSVTSIGERAFYKCSSLTSVTIPNSVTSIGNGAFISCRGLTSVTIPNSVTSIGSSAFRECSGLTSISNYANTPQEIYSSIFDLVDKATCVLYVPAGSVSAYQSADVWKDFSNILPIGAQPADVTTTTVTPSETTANIAWPQVTGAATYTIEIKKNGELICTLTFNAQGQLISIAFAPSRDGQAHAPQAIMTANGLQFTVTGLDSGTEYDYTITAKDANGDDLNTESGSFTTTGGDNSPTGLDGVSSNDQTTKILHNGQILILRGEKTYTMTGQEVR